MKHLKYIALILFVWLGAACEQLPLPNTELTIKSEIVTEVTANSAIIEVEFNPTAATIQNVYACYTSTEKTVMEKVSDLKYRVKLSPLGSNTKYHVHYMVTNPFSSVTLKNNLSFTTKEQVTAAPEYVDLGLSVKWATMNVGASSPEEYGDYFAWGETEPKSTYDWSTYKWCNGSSTTLTKYCTSSSYGTVDNKKTLELSDDAAYANWGGEWRTPTEPELSELRTQCTWTWTTQNGVNGYKVTSKSNGNSIFLPAAGYRDDSSLGDAGSYGRYWSSSLYTDYPSDACGVYFYSSDVVRSRSDRDYGRSVRPVYVPQSEQTTAPTVVTSAVTQITQTSAVAGGNVTSDGGASSTERGVVYSTNPNPVITNLSNTILPCGSGAGSFTCNLTGLQPNTTYYIRAYAKNDVGTAYGEEVIFTTLADVNISEPTGTENSYGYVDLGLSVKWATFNVGATKPEDYGDYFAWGETEPKDVYYESTYKWCNGSGTLTKYCTDDNKTVLEAIDDVAAVKWGGNWRMPTVAELTELLEQCTWTWTSHNGVNGYKVTSNSNGNSIFLPAAGVRDTGSHDLIGIYGGYWSNTLNMGRVVGAYTVHCNSNGVIELNDFDRWYGLSVRPVYGTAPTVVTSAVTQITETTAVAGGNVTSDGGASVTERGVVYSTTQNPTAANSKVASGSGTGAFTCNLTGLQPNTTYYVRAYAVNSKGTSYGEQVTFTTLTPIVVPTVMTSTITQITETTAVAGGNVTSDGGASSTERGVVYSTNPNPVITNLSNTILPCGSGAGSFTCNLTGLQPNTTYYIRAYAKNDAGTAYGEEMSFTTQIQKPTTPYFSVSQTKYITFSPGNLQYTQSTNTWSFAENQWDMIGTDNVTGGSVSSDSKNGDRKEGTALADKVDLFGWSTSAMNFGVSTSKDDHDYSGSFVDWGTNQIGADAPNTWRTLTYDEWEYLLNTRPNASSLKGVAQVNGVNGLILLPDNWTCPSGVTFKSGFHSEWGVDYYAAYQTFTAAEWSKLEAAGAVFLPAAGDRYGLSVRNVQGDGYYWSASEYDSNIAYCLRFYSGQAFMDNIFDRTVGLPVRLVKDL